MIRIIALSLLMLFLSAAPAAADSFRDFSKAGPEHKILTGVMLDALDVDFVQKRPVEVYGKLVEASIFSVRTSQTVPFLAGSNPYNNVMKDIYGFYDLVVAEDVGSQIHDALIESIHSSLLGDKGWNDMGFMRGKSSYLVYFGEAKSPQVVWIAGKVVHVRFRQYSEKRFDLKSDVESFWNDKIRFDLDGSRVRIESPKKAIREQFLQLYKDGAFSKKSS